MKARLIIFLSVLLFLTPMSTVAYADNTDVAAFSYKIIKPENQQGTANYFNLRMSPGQKQTVQIEIENNLKKKISVEIGLNSVKTNANGVLNSGPSDLETDESLLHDFSKIVTAPKKIDLPAKGKTTLKLNINMPDEEFDGVISGGIYMKKILTKEEEKEEKKLKGLISEYSFIVGMLLSENDKVVEPDLKFNNAYAGIENYKGVIFLNLSNYKAAYLADMMIEAQVTKKNSEKVLYESKKSGMQMAPNSMIEFPVAMKESKMQPGDYTVTIYITSGEREWTWEKDFTITLEEAKKYNAQDVTITSDQTIDWTLILLIILGIALILLVLYFIFKNVQKPKKSRKKKRKKKKRL